MAANEPIDPRVRLAITQWPDDAPRGAVSTFCAEHGISRKSFYKLRKRAPVEGPAEVLEPRIRRPRPSPSKLTNEVKEQAVQVRTALEASRLDHGPDQRARQDAHDGAGALAATERSVAIAGWHGGALQYLNAYGLPAAMTRAHELAVEHGARFTPPVLLTRKSKSGETFC